MNQINLLLRKTLKPYQRFFKDFELDYCAIANILVTLMAIPQPWVLSTDRTE
ncbi:MAG: hypothetical protein IGR93_10420 [Hydrococcus sp. C42_A2020_068]|nr:hypothetical protein [Hydrococcus sp. C42_A2020_068]